jgi:hypothetical protein
MRHGLAVELDPTLGESGDINLLAAALANGTTDPVRWHFASRAAKAELQLQRVNEARKLLLERSGVFNSSAEQDPALVARLIRELDRLQRYETRAASQRDRAIRLLYQSV